jgi:hypothetical protein
MLLSSSDFMLSPFSGPENVMKVKFSRIPLQAPQRAVRSGRHPAYSPRRKKCERQTGGHARRNVLIPQSAIPRDGLALARRPEENVCQGA